MTAAIIFLLTYISIALGRIPGLVIDRAGIALLGAISMVVFHIVTVEQAIHAIDFSTILLLFGLMIISAQLRLGGFYSWSAARIMFLLGRPRIFLLYSMILSALLSAVLANDIVCFAFTPILALSVRQAGVNPLPFLLGLAISSNIGSAATIIGNPQNMLIGQVGHLDFESFLSWCSPPSLLALGISYTVLLWLFRGKLLAKEPPPVNKTIEGQWPSFDLWQSSKGIFAICILVILFFTPVPREIAAIGVAGVLLCSRKMRTKDILVLIDWHLIILFCALFIVIQGISQHGFLDVLAGRMINSDIRMDNLPLLAAISALLSNMVSNVPAVMILIRFLDPANALEWYTLAVSSTFAGNLITIGSIANIIVIEQAAHCGVNISFRKHAAAGIPVTLASFAVLFFWLCI